MKRRIRLFIILSILIVSSGTAQIMPDKPGTDIFKLYKNNSLLGEITCNLDNKGNYSRKFILSYAGQTVKFEMKIISDDNRIWRKCIIKSPTETIKAENRDSVSVFTKEDKKYKVRTDSSYFVYDNYGFFTEEEMIRTYDLKRSGIQHFSIFIIPSLISDVTIEYKGERITGSGRFAKSFKIFNMNLLGISVEFWVDNNYKIMLKRVPSQYAVFVRKGFEDLMSLCVTDTTVSQPKYEVKKETVMIPMRDGVKLATDLYFPKGLDKKAPVVLIRTPYKKEIHVLDGKFYARRGYVAAVQDCRGRFDSEGEWEPMVNEKFDGYDTIEWLASQPWSDGKVGMIGGSYSGMVQVQAAATRPPHLTTIIPQVSPPDPFYNIPYEYGTFFIFGAIWWADVLEKEATKDISGKIMAEINNKKYQKILSSLPVIDLDKKVLGKKSIYWRNWIKNNYDNTFWERADFLSQLENVDIPVFLQSGWFDGDGIGTKLIYYALKKGGNKNVKVIIGPWGHTNQSSSRYGDYEFGQEAALDLQTRFLKWFDFYLKGIKNDIMDEDRIKLFVMFENKWIGGSTYPLEKTKFVPLYLSSGKSAQTSSGDGLITTVANEHGTKYDEFLYDPADPTPYPEFYFKSDEDEKKKSFDLKELRKKVREFHQSVTEKRKDILVYQTAPLDSELTIAGPLSIILFASTTGKDTDWFAAISDVDTSGMIFQLARGGIRARFRKSVKKPELLNPGQIYEYKIDLWHTGITFKKGHRIRIEISSAQFPMFSRNLNTGGNNETDTVFVKAVQRIYHTREYPTRVIIPVVNLKQENLSPEKIAK